MIAEAARRAGMKKIAVFEFDEFEPLLEWLKVNLTEKDAVLIKGSHGLRMDRITSHAGGAFMSQTSLRAEPGHAVLYDDRHLGPAAAAHPASFQDRQDHPRG